jgi:ATP-binding cassette subfamily B (MDR/TAP) protein 1
MIEMSKFFTYATRWEKMLMALGTIGAIIAGFLLPCISIAMGAVTNTYDPRNSQDQVLNDMKMICIYICLTGIGCWFFGYIYYAFWQHLA